MKTETANKILSTIKPAIDEYSLEIELIPSEYKSDGPVHSIKITDPVLPYFDIRVYAETYRMTDKCEFSVSSSYMRTWKAHTNYSDGSGRSISKQYDLSYILSSEEMIALGIEKEDYSYSLRYLNKASKIDKNPKLLLKDFLAVLKPYHEAIKMITPRLNDKIAHEIETLRLRNEFEKMTGTWLSDDLERERALTVGKYKFTFSQYDSDPTVSYVIPYEEACNLAK